LATITQRQPGRFFARVWVPPTSDGQPGRQVGKVFRGGTKEVRQRVAAWEAEVRGTVPSTVGATVADLLRLWIEARQLDWQPASART
jgi:hypothetical protein